MDENKTFARYSSLNMGYEKSSVMEYFGGILLLFNVISINGNKKHLNLKNKPYDLEKVSFDCRHKTGIHIKN